MAICIIGSNMAAHLKDVVEDYKRIINGPDVDMDLARRTWAIEDDITFIHPAGYQHGWPDIEKNFYGFVGSLSERKMKTFDLQVHEYETFGWLEFRWRFTAKNPDGSPVFTEGRETQVVRKDGSEWRIVHIHYSGLPAAAH